MRIRGLLLLRDSYSATILYCAQVASETEEDRAFIDDRDENHSQDDAELERMGFPDLDDISPYFKDKCMQCGDPISPTAQLCDFCLRH